MRGTAIRSKPQRRATKYLYLKYYLILDRWSGSNSSEGVLQVAKPSAKSVARVRITYCKHQLNNNSSEGELQVAKPNAKSVVLGPEDIVAGYS